MILKLVFLSMLCIPVGYFQFILITDAARDVKKPERKIKSKETIHATDEYYYQSSPLKIAR